MPEITLAIKYAVPRSTFRSYGRKRGIFYIIKTKDTYGQNHYFHYLCHRCSYANIVNHLY